MTTLSFLQDLKPAEQWLRDHDSIFDDLEFLFVRCKGYVELQKFMWIVNTKLTEIDVHDYDSLTDVHEAFLTYLYPLLKHGNLKMRRILVEKIPRDELPEKDRNNPLYLGGVRQIGVKEYDSAEAAINDLRELWNTAGNDPSAIDTVEYNVHFALPENPWLK